MQICITGEYKTYIIIRDTHNNLLYKGNVFQLLNTTESEIEIFFNSKRYVVRKVSEEYFLIIGKGSYSLIERNDLLKIVNYSYKEIDIKNILDIKLGEFLEMYFEKNISEIEVYFEGVGNNFELFSFDILEIR